MNAIPKALIGGALLLSTLLLCAQVQAASLTLSPAGGALFGAPGAAVGWGFTLANDVDYLVVSGADFTAPLDIGDFDDWIGPQAILLGPGEMLSQAFAPADQTGLGRFSIDPAALAGALAQGWITLSYDRYSRAPNDPNFDPGRDQISVGNLLTAAASVTVVAEPGSLALLASAIPIALARRRARRR